MAASTPLLPSVAKELPDTARDAYAAATEDVQTRLTRRLPPLVLTLCIEMGNAAIIMSYSGELLRYPLLVGFIPVISALGGNIGLQSSSITTRALSHGLASADEATATIRHEMSAVVFLSAALSAMLFAIAATWRSIQTNEMDFGFGLVVAISQFVSAIMGGFLGVLTPLFYRYLDMDPASNAGPLDTAVQDVLGNSLFLATAGWLLNVFGY